MTVVDCGEETGWTVLDNVIWRFAVLASYLIVCTCLPIIDKPTVSDNTSRKAVHTATSISQSVTSKILTCVRCAK